MKLVYIEISEPMCHNSGIGGVAVTRVEDCDYCNSDGLMQCSVYDNQTRNRIDWIVKQK